MTGHHARAAVRGGTPNHRGFARGGAVAVMVTLVATGVSARTEQVRHPPPAGSSPAAVRTPAVPPTLSTAAAAVATSLHAASTRAATMGRLRSLLVSWRGELVAEHYFRGATARRTANIKSASKSIVSALIGIAIGRGAIGSVHDPIERYLPDVQHAAEGARKRAITIEDLLTMRSGLESTSNRNYGAWVRSTNWVRYVLNRPMVDAPGSSMQYSTGSTHLLSAILTRATRTSTWEFARDALAKPLGIALARWQQDPQGIYFGGNEMVMTPRQMLTFGELYLNHGRWQSQQVVPASWITESFVPRAQSRFSGRMYGYGWWMRELAGHQTYYAWGYGGQFIFVVPDLDLVAVTTSLATPSTERRDHLDAVYELVAEAVIAPVAAELPDRPAGRR